jgi:Spy/CpxP family protein refolding chaperone
MMNIESKSKWQIRFATLGIFVLGIVAGAFALNAYYLWFGAAKAPTKQEKYEDAFNKLKLDEAQKVEIQKIFGETRESIQKMRQETDPRLLEIRTQNDEKLQKVLRPEQWQQFQQEREKIHESEKQQSPTPTPRPLNLQ